jgi:hypothetical protein
MNRKNIVSGVLVALVISLSGFGSLANTLQNDTWNEAEAVTACAAGAGPVPMEIFNVVVDYCTILELVEDIFQATITNTTEDLEVCGEDAEPVLILIFDLVVEYCTLHDLIESAMEATTSLNN